MLHFVVARLTDYEYVKLRAAVTRIIFGVEAPMELALKGPGLMQAKGEDMCLAVVLEGETDAVRVIQCALEIFQLIVESVDVGG
jgi:hypothetical protein